MLTCAQINDMALVIGKLKFYIKENGLVLTCSDTGFLPSLTVGQLIEAIFMTAFIVHIICLTLIQEMTSITILQMVHQHL